MTETEQKFNYDDYHTWLSIVRSKPTSEIKTTLAHSTMTTEARRAFEYELDRRKRGRRNG